MSELRYNPVKNFWTVISPERSRKRDNFIIKKEKKIAEPEGSACPFCGEAKGLYEIYRISDGKGSWSLKTVPNRYPVLGIEGVLVKNGAGCYDQSTGIGAHEIIIDSPRHSLKAEDYTEQELYNLFTAFKVRIEDLYRDLRFRYVSAFKNIGADAGERINHPHAQIVAFPVIPPRVADEFHRASNHYVSKERCFYCDALEWETERKNGIILENYDFVALCPYASAYPFEITVYPKKHSSSLLNEGSAALGQLADIVKELFLRISRTLDSPSVSIALRSAPQAWGRPDPAGLLKEIDASFHWHMEIKPAVTVPSGSEWGMGIAANPVTPEEAARYLKEAASG